MPLNFFTGAGVLDVRLEAAGIPTLLLADASSSAEFVISALRAMEAELPVYSSPTIKHARCKGPKP